MLWVWLPYKLLQACCLVACCLLLQSASVLLCSRQAEDNNNSINCGPSRGKHPLNNNSKTVANLVPATMVGHRVVSVVGMPAICFECLRPTCVSYCPCQMQSHT